MYVYCKNDVLFITNTVRKRGRYSCPVAEFIRADIADRNMLYVDYTGCTVEQIIDALASAEYLAQQGLTEGDRAAVDRLRQGIISLVYRPDPMPDEYVVTAGDGMVLDIFKSYEIPVYAHRYGFRAEDIRPACQFWISGSLWIEDISWALEIDHC